MKKIIVMVAVMAAMVFGCMVSYESGRHEGVELGYAEGQTSGYRDGYSTGSREAYKSHRTIRAEMLNELYAYEEGGVGYTGYTFEVDGVVKYIAIDVVDIEVVDPSVYKESES